MAESARLQEPFIARLLIVRRLAPKLSTPLARVEGLDSGISRISALAVKVPFRVMTSPGCAEMVELLIVIANCARAQPASGTAKTAQLLQDAVFTSPVQA
jgi:hypothetical protein